MRVSWPFLPVLIVLGALCVLAGSGFLLVMPSGPSVPLYTGDVSATSETVTPVQAVKLVSAPGSDVQGQKRALLAASPFVQSRAPFSRGAPVQVVAEPELRPEFLGFLGSGSERRVMIAWEQNTDPQTHAIGSETPWGVLVEAEEGGLLFKEGDKVRELSLFGR